MPLSPEWAKLPKRRCDDCGKMYKQVRPRREGEMGFCTDNCRKSYHKHGGAYRKLKVELEKMVTRRMADLEKPLREIVREEILINRLREVQAQPGYSQSPLATNSPTAHRANR